MDLPLYSEWLFCSPFAHLESGSFCGFYDLMTPVGSDQGAEMNVASCCNPSFPFSRAPFSLCPAFSGLTVGMELHF